MAGGSQWGTSTAGFPKLCPGAFRKMPAVGRGVPGASTGVIGIDSEDFTLYLTSINVNDADRVSVSQCVLLSGY